MNDPLYLLLGLSLAMHIGTLAFLCVIWLRMGGDDGEEHV